MPKPLLIDTQALLWWVLGSPHLSETARTRMQERVDEGEKLLVSAWSVVELVYATEKATTNATRVQREDLDAVIEVIEDAEGSFQSVPVDLPVARHVRDLPREWSNDPWDRTIIATAFALGATLVTADEPHRANPDIDTLW